MEVIKYDLSNVFIYFYIKFTDTPLYRKKDAFLFLRQKKRAWLIMSEYKETIIKLIESDTTGYKIYKETGISQTVLSELRTGKRDLDNLTLKTTEKLYEYAKSHLDEGGN